MAARRIEVRYGDEESVFAFTRVDRGKLYGRKVRVIEDEDGHPCVPAYLTPDGAALVPPGGTAHLYVDEDLDTVERADLRAVDPDGQPLEAVPSTLGVPQELEPVRPERLLDHRIASVYELSPDALGARLKQALADGELFEAPFNYREGYDPDVLFLLQNDEGLFGLVGRETGFDFLEREAPAAEAAEDEDEDEDADELAQDLDFSF
jgi:hypothetical protein